MNPRPQAPGAKPSYTDLESALVAEREAREEAEKWWAATCEGWKQEAEEARRRVKEYSSLADKLEERAEKAEEALREALNAEYGNAAERAHGLADAIRVALSASLSAVPAQRCPYNDPNCSCLEKAAPQPEEENE